MFLFMSSLIEASKLLADMNTNSVQATTTLKPSISLNVRLLKESENSHLFEK